MPDRHRDNGFSGPTLSNATMRKLIFGRAGISTRAQLRTFVLTGALPGGGTITAAVFQRACLVLALDPLLPGEQTDDDAVDTGA
jgi:hypothetical protein